MGTVEVSLKDASVIRTARILVIEDNASDVFLLNRALKKQDFPFELVHLLNGGEALAFIRRQGAYAEVAIPDLILMDLNLSKYTGEDILREIRAVRITEASFKLTSTVPMLSYHLFCTYDPPLGRRPDEVERVTRHQRQDVVA